MQIKEEISEQDRIDIALELNNLTGMIKKKLFKARIMWFVILALGIIMVLFGLNFLKKNNSALFYFELFFLILGIVYCIRALFAIIFLKRNYKSHMIKNLKKYDATVRQKYNLNDTYEITTEIKDGYIETSSLGTTTKYSLKDYISKSENERFYIFEFSNGRYFFFKKEAFKTQEAYDELVNEFEKGKKD
jgi:predicted membrane protein